nr:helix-turn-helix domain-containing protein [uncultured Oscillibacter sp.]
MADDDLEVRKASGDKRIFPLPNEIFSLGLSSGALAVYSCLLYCEDRKTYQCDPSCASIGKSVCMSVNTVRKYVTKLEERGLMVTEPTSVTTRDGRKRNGTLRYTILPIQNAADLHNQRQLRRLEEIVERMRGREKLEGNEEHPA